MQKVVFNAALRTADEKPKVIRRNGLIPANVYIPGKESIMLTLKAHDFAKLYDQVGESGLVYLEVDDKKQLPVLVQEVQLDSLSGAITHVVFRNVSLKEKITAEVPVEFVGEFEVANGVLVTVRDYLPLEALPTEMPDHLTVDLSLLTEIGQSVLVKDVSLPSDAVSLAVSEEDLESPVVLVQEQKEEEVVEEEAPVTEIIGEKPAEEAAAATPEDKS